METRFLSEANYGAALPVGIPLGKAMLCLSFSVNSRPFLAPIIRNYGPTTLRAEQEEAISPIILILPIPAGAV